MGISSNKSSQKATSSNQAYDFLRGSLGGSVNYLDEGARGISDLLSGNSSGFDAFKGATGFDDRLISGLRDVTGVKAAAGTFNSGATGKALMGYGQKLQNDTAQNYIQNLLGLSGIGGAAAGIIGGAGNRSESSGKSKGLSYTAPSFGGG